MIYFSLSSGYAPSFVSFSGILKLVLTLRRILFNSGSLSLLRAFRTASAVIRKQNLLAEAYCIIYYFCRIPVFQQSSLSKIFQLINIWTHLLNLGGPHKLQSLLPSNCRCIRSFLNPYFSKPFCLLLLSFGEYLALP